MPPVSIESILLLFLLMQNFLDDIHLRHERVKRKYVERFVIDNTAAYTHRLPAKSL